MMLKTKDGIACDLCGEKYRNRFEYFSFEGQKLQVTGQTTQNLGKAIEFDACENCYNKMLGKRTESQNAFLCDECGSPLSGSFEYIFLEATKVAVDEQKARADGILEPDVMPKLMDFRIDVQCCNMLVEDIMKTRRAIKDDQSI